MRWQQLSKYIISIILFLGIVIPLGEHASAESFKYAYDPGQSNSLDTGTSAKELKKYRAVDPRRGLIGK